MIKKIFGLVFLVLVVAVFTAAFFAEVILASFLTNVLGAPVKIGDLKFGAKTGIYGLVIGNPPGFKEERMISISEASVYVDVGALLKGRIHINKVKLAMDEATIEKVAGGKLNLLELKVMKKPEKKADSGTKEPPSTKPSEPGKPGKPAQAIAVQIDEVVLDLDKARYVDSGVSPASVKEYSLGVRNESFKNVTNLNGLIKQLVFFILKKVGLSSLTSNLDVLLKGVGGDMGEKFGQLMEKLNNL